MSPDRAIEINGQNIEEFYWAGKMIVYVNNKLISQGFDEACRNINEGKENTYK